MLASLVSLLTVANFALWSVKADNVIVSPANETSVSPGSSFNFTYISDDDDTARIDVALIRVVPLVDRLTPENRDGGRWVSTDISVPADTPAGTYVIGVDEQDDNDSADWDDQYDYDVTHGTATNANDEAPVYVTVQNAQSARSLRFLTKRQSNNTNNNSDGDAVLYSPTNDTVVNRGSSFNFTYRLDDDDDDDNDTVRVALLSYYRVLNGSEAQVWNNPQGNNNDDGDDDDDYRRVEATISVPSDMPAGQYIIGVRELDQNESASDIFDFDIGFEASLGDDNDDRVFVINVGGSGGTTPSGSASASSGTGTTPTSTSAGGSGGNGGNGGANTSAPAGQGPTGGAMRNAASMTSGLVGLVLAWAMA